MAIDCRMRPAVTTAYWLAENGWGWPQCPEAANPSALEQPTSDLAAGVRPGTRPRPTGFDQPFATGNETDSFAARDENESSRGAQADLGFRKTAHTAANAFAVQATLFAQDVGLELGKAGEDQKKRGVDAIRNVARAIDSAASELEGQSPTVARMVHETARQVGGLSDNLSQRNVNELVRTAADLARTQPALFIGGSVVAGFALARFLRSSSERRRQAGYNPYR